MLTAAQLSELLHLVRRLPAAPSVVSYAVKLARSTRPDAPEASAKVKKYVSWGAGPRASQYLILGAKARAAMDGRAMPDLEDVAGDGAAGAQSSRRAELPGGSGRSERDVADRAADEGIERSLATPRGTGVLPEPTGSGRAAGSR